MNLTHTVSLLEVFLVVIGLIGIGLCLLMFATLWRDRGILRAAGQNGIDRRLVMGNMRVVLFCLFVIVVFTALGTLAMFVPEPVRSENRTQGEIVAWALILIDVGAVLIILWDYIDRQRNMADLAHRQRGAVAEEATAEGDDHEG